jgi:nitroreductase
MSNQVLSCIAQRRSHRKYLNIPLTEEQIATLIAAAEQAPSAVNRQPWHITVVEDAAIIQDVHDACRKEVMKQPEENRSARYQDPAFQVFYHAPCVFFFSCDDSRYAQTDVGIAIQNVCLAAQSMGLGTVILGLPRDAFAGEDKERLEKLLQFPAGYRFMLAVSIGHADDTKPAHPIREGLVTRIP